MDGLNISEVRRYLGIKSAAVYAAIRNNRVKGTKVGKRWCFTIDDLDEYVKTRHSRTLKRDREGKMVFDVDKGKCSPRQAAQALKVTDNSIYYAIRKGRVKAKRFGKCSYVIDLEEVKKYMSELHKKKY